MICWLVIHILVQPGARIPVDGEVLSGESRVNEADAFGRTCSDTQDSWRTGDGRYGEWIRSA